MSSERAARLVPLFSGWSKLAYWAGVAVWLAALWHFWAWWFQPDHNIWAFGYTVVTVVLAWVTLLPLYFILIFAGAKRIQGQLALPTGSRVAMIVTKAPSEPPELLKKTLRAMLAQDLPHDTWIADEDPGPEMIAWCRENGVHISTRKGVEAYHQKMWPRRTRCKEGNLAYFYDNFGYDRYDFVAQLDADHVPEPDYLREILKPFRDPQVGYVSAPSICDANSAESWSATGRLHVEASMHGALQIGYNDGWAPLCIGSHYAVRTSALREIGGLGPELAEDHSTTLLFNAGGWRGVHAIDAIAHGDGPNTFSDLATQEFQWSRSLMMILLQYTPHYLSALQPSLKFQFVFSQLWYPLFSLMMAAMYVMPIAALTLGTPFVGVTFPDFVVHFLPVGIVLTLLAFSWRKAGVFRPADVPILSWQGAAFLFARWPWSLWGCVAAVRDYVTGTVVDFRVTPKGTGPAAALPRRVLAPYAVLSVASALAALLVADPGRAGGFYVFAIVNALVYGGIFGLIVWRHAVENGLGFSTAGPGGAVAAQAAATVLMLALPVGAAALRGEQGIEAIFWGLDELRPPPAEATAGPSDTPEPAGRAVSPDVGVSFGGEHREPLADAVATFAVLGATAGQN